MHELESLYPSYFPYIVHFHYGHIKSQLSTSYLVRYSLSCLLGVVALVDDIADLLAIHNEVNAISGQRQERVMSMVQLKKGKAIFRNISNYFSAKKLKLHFYKPTDILLVSGSAMTPMFFRSKSPMLRVMANLPLTFGCPRLFQVIKPPLLFILGAGAE